MTKPNRKFKAVPATLDALIEQHRQAQQAFRAIPEADEEGKDAGLERLNAIEDEIISFRPTNMQEHAHKTRFLLEAIQWGQHYHDGDYTRSAEGMDQQDSALFSILTDAEYFASIEGAPAPESLDPLDQPLEDAIALVRVLTDANHVLDVGHRAAVLYEVQSKLDSLHAEYIKLCNRIHFQKTTA